MYLNKTLLLGNLGADAKVSEHGERTKFACRLATTRKWRDGKGDPKEATQWHRVVYWTGVPNVVAYFRERLVKGALVYAEGSIEYPEIDGENGKLMLTEIVASNLQVIPQARAASAQHEAPVVAAANGMSNASAVNRWAHSDRPPLDQEVPAPEDNLTIT